MSPSRTIVSGATFQTNRDPNAICVPEPGSRRVFSNAGGITYGEELFEQTYNSDNKTSSFFDAVQNEEQVDDYEMAVQISINTTECTSPTGPLHNVYPPTDPLIPTAPINTPTDTPTNDEDIIHTTNINDPSETDAPPTEYDNISMILVTLDSLIVQSLRHMVLE